MQKGSITVGVIIALATLIFGGYWLAIENRPEPTEEIIQPKEDIQAGVAPRILRSSQVGTGATVDYILSTNGATSTWIANTGGGGGGGEGGLFDYETEGADIISPNIASTSNTAQLNISSIYATSTATSSTFSGGLIAASSTFTGTTTVTDDVLFGSINNFYWDNANSRLAINGNENTLTLNGTTAGSALTIHSEGSEALFQVAWERHSDTPAFAPINIFGRSRGTEASETAVQNDDVLSSILSVGHDGTDWERAADISVAVDGTPGNNDMPGRIVFSTTPDGSVTLAERMRITATGSVGIGTTSPSRKLTVGGDGYFGGNLTATGTLAIPTLTSALTLTDGSGVFAEYTGTTCTNQFTRALSALGVATCATVDISADTNLTAGTNITLSIDTLNVDDAFLVNDANDTTTGILTVGGIDLGSLGNRIDFDADNDTSIRSVGDDDLTFEQLGVDRTIFGIANYRFNDTSLDMDFIMDGDTVADLFFLNAGTDRVGIGSTSPMSIFGVGGTTTTETLNVVGSATHTGTSTQYIFSNTSGFGGELILEDNDGAGCTSITVLNGTVTGTTVTCPTVPAPS